MKHVVHLTPRWEFQLIHYLSNLFGHLVRPIKTWLERFISLLLEGGLFVRLEPKKNQVPNLNVPLNLVPVNVHLLLILGYL